MQIKEGNWFAAGPEVQRAFRLLSDGAFRLYFYLASNAGRSTGAFSGRYKDIAIQVDRSPRSIVIWVDELKKNGVCEIRPGANQHSVTEFLIADEFWPYTREGAIGKSAPLDSYIQGVRSMLSARACIRCTFTEGDREFAADLFAQGVSLEQIKRAIALACCRKYVGLLNGTDKRLIRHFSYFRDAIEEVRNPNAHPIQAQQLDQRIMTAEYYERKWLASSASLAGADFASASRPKNQETR